MLSPLPNAMPPHLNRVLLAEDEEAPRRVLVHYLQSWGFSPVLAADGAQAASILGGKDAPAIALLDWVMPRLDGPELCRRVRQEATEKGRPYTYLILVTGKADRSEVTIGLQAGADDYVVKPFDVAELRARLHVAQRVISLERRLAENVEMLNDALTDATELRSGPVAVCPRCGRVHPGREGSGDDPKSWLSPEDYLREHTGAEVRREPCPQHR